jgi:RNase adaptor protein for sRNA GlmZ degradation
MIIWLNGTFGAGKTTASTELIKRLPDSRIFDTEDVGFMLKPVLDSVQVNNFQEWPPWRGLVVETAARVLDYVGGTLVIPQSVLVESFWAEIRSGLEKAGIPVHHFVLHADRDTLVNRIENDTLPPGVRQWRLEHLTPYQEALPWLEREAEVIDTSQLTPDQVTDSICSSVAKAA